MNKTTFILSDATERHTVDFFWQGAPVAERIETESPLMRAALETPGAMWTPVGRVIDRKHYWWVHTVLRSEAGLRELNLEVIDPPGDELLQAPRTGEPAPEGSFDAI